MGNRYNPLRSVLQSVSVPRLRNRGSVPVNKSSGGTVGRMLPQLDNPVLLGVAAAGAFGAGITMTRLRSAGRGGRPERFAALLGQALAESSFAVCQVSPAVSEGTQVSQGFEVVAQAKQNRAIVWGLGVEVLEGFGKLPLISIDVTVNEGSPLWSDVVGQQILEVLARAAWNNPEIAPVAVRGRLLSAASGQELAGMVDAGFDAEVARPQELLERFGPPVFDPTWRG